MDSDETSTHPKLATRNLAPCSLEIASVETLAGRVGVYHLLEEIPYIVGRPVKPVGSNG